MSACAAEAPPAIDAEWVSERLDRAGATLLALRLRGHSLDVRVGGTPDYVRDAAEGYGWSASVARAAIPSPREISAMDEAFGWLPLIPDGRFVLRRIVGARALVAPASGRRVYTWRRLGRVVGADYRAVQRWHAEGIGLIVEGLRRGKFFRRA